MIRIIHTIVPIFLIILMGAVIRSKGFLSTNLTEALNRLVYYVAIPAMIFKAVAEASFQDHFDYVLLAGTLIPVIVVFFIALFAGRLLSVPRTEMGTFLQSSYHGNLGYIGFAVTFYFIGKEALTTASILAGFLTSLQNFLSILGLQTYSKQVKGRQQFWYIIKSFVLNPIILSAVAGIVLSLMGIGLHTIIERSLGIIAGMALPLALLVIGASLSFGMIRSHLGLVFGAGLFKLILMPAFGYLFFQMQGLDSAQFLPGLILLASPTATVTYVMATQMKGSPHLATGAISLSTLLSSATFIFWLSISI